MDNHKQIFTDSYAELFEKILARPVLYVGNCSIIKIGAFMEGYKYAKLKIEEPSEDDLYNGFNQWVARRFKIQSAHNWVSIIDSMAGSEESAFELTKKMWNEYKTAFEKRLKHRKIKPVEEV